MKYTPLAVSDYLELDDDGEENEGGNNRASNTLWIKDLEFQHGENKCVPLAFARGKWLIIDIAYQCSKPVHPQSYA